MRSTKRYKPERAKMVALCSVSEAINNGLLMIEAEPDYIGEYIVCVVDAIDHAKRKRGVNAEDVTGISSDSWTIDRLEWVFGKFVRRKAFTVEDVLKLYNDYYDGVEDLAGHEFPKAPEAYEHRPKLLLELLTNLEAVMRDGLPLRAPSHYA